MPKKTKDPDDMTPEELHEFLESQRPKGPGAKRQMGTYNAWVDMIRKCSDPTYPGYLNHGVPKRRKSDA